MSTKSTLTTGAAGRSPLENFRTTRSNSNKNSTQQASTSPQAATLEKKKAKAEELETEARKLLTNEGCLKDGTNITHSTVLNALTQIIQKYSTTTPQNLARALAALTVLFKQANNVSNADAQFEPIADIVSQKIEESIGKAMQEEMHKMSSFIKSSLAEQSKALSPSEDLVETVTTLKQVASDMSKSINEATTATTQISDTANSYKQALLRTTSQTYQPQQAKFNADSYTDEEGLLPSPRNTGNYEQIDPRILRDIDRKARQILVDTMDPNITEASLTEIKEKVCTAISKIANPAPPKDTTVLEITKLRTGGITILFKDKEVVEWIQDPGVEFEFTTELSRDASIVKRSYSLLVPRIPLSFDPANEEHLREVEECNGLPTNTITKARWIKPINRRVPGQRAAHAIFSLGDITLANECIRDGLKVCGLHIHPSRLKNEPMQCMKCRRWGHFAHSCTASIDTCGTCGEEHRTSECSNKEKTFCVSCRSNTHASWDRDCPEFRRRCDQFDENYPENNLPYFPSEEGWTLIPRPNKLHRAEKFPAKDAVVALQQAEHANKDAPTKAQNRHPKQRSSKRPANQSTIDQYITTESTQTTGQSNPSKSNKADAAALSYAEFSTLNHKYLTPEEGQEPQGWD